jgi:outer membrane protein assembly factor BamB
MTSMRRLATVVAVVMVIGPAARAQDWPAFRGPTGQGHSTERGLPLEWSESTNVIWKVPVPGRGWSSPVVADGRVWLTTAAPDRTGSLRLLAYDVGTGREVLDSEVFRVDQTASPNPKNSLASPTPVIDVGDGRVYVHFGADGTAALTTDGELLWSRQFPHVTQHGNGGSPVLYRDRLILSVDGYDTAYVVALDAATGDERWRTVRRNPISQAYSTPLIIRVGEGDQLFSIGAFRATAYDPDSGAEIWEVSYGDGFSNVPAPVFGHGMVYVATGFQVPSVIAVRADGRGDVTGTHTAWTLRRGAPLTPSPLLVGDELYIVSDLGIATCLDARTGATHWRERLGGNFSASPVFADGRIYFQSEEGVTTVLAPGTAYRELATNRLDGATLASMAVASGSLFIRTHDHLYRLGSRP